MKESTLQSLIDLISDKITSTEFNTMSLIKIEEKIIPICVRDYNLSVFLAKYIAKTIYTSKKKLSYINFGFQQ